jgi:hypothetical protein
MGTIGMLMLGFAIGRRFEQRQAGSAASPTQATVASGYVDASPYVRAAREQYARRGGRA